MNIEFLCGKNKIIYRLTRIQILQAVRKSGMHQIIRSWENSICSKFKKVMINVSHFSNAYVGCVHKRIIDISQNIAMTNFLVIPITFISPINTWFFNCALYFFHKRILTDFGLFLRQMKVLYNMILWACCKKKRCFIFLLSPCGIRLGKEYITLRFFNTFSFIQNMKKKRWKLFQKIKTLQNNNTCCK